MIFILEKQELYHGFHLVCMFVHSHRCGYVGLPCGSKSIAKDYYELDFDVHGGITYSEKKPSFALNGFGWYLGFDCAHCFDGADVVAMKKYGAREEEIEIYKWMTGEVRTQDFVMNELYSLIAQLEGETK